MNQSVRDMIERLGGAPELASVPTDSVVETDYVEKLASACEEVLSTGFAFTADAPAAPTFDPQLVVGGVIARMKEKQASVADDRRSHITTKVLAKLAAVEAAQAVAAPVEPPPPPEEAGEAEEDQEAAAEAPAEMSEDENLEHLSLSDVLQDALGAGTSDASPSQQAGAETGDEATSDIGDKVRQSLIKKLKVRVHPEQQRGA